jgi:hypothetical protein
LSACRALRYVTITASTYGGAVSSSEMTLLSRLASESAPSCSVLTTVGKKLVTVPLATMQNSRTSCMRC